MYVKFTRKHILVQYNLSDGKQCIKEDIGYRQCKYNVIKYYVYIHNSLYIYVILYLL